MAKLSVKDLDVSAKKVLMRADFNVPLDDNGNITDDTRIRAALPTIKHLLDNGAAKVILMSHLGRPKGQAVPKYSLKPVAGRLQELLGVKVTFIIDCVGQAVKEEAAASEDKVVLLENLRYHPEEEKNDPAFAGELASLGDIYVNDAFGTAHRAHASTEGVARHLKAAAGFLLEKEIQYLGSAIRNPQKPFLVILGGAKVSDKIAVIDNLIEKCDGFIIGGGMAYTFLKAKGEPIGNSKLEADKLDVAAAILTKAEAAGKGIFLPVDHVVADTIAPDAATEVVETIPEGKIAVDVGPKSVELFKDKLKDAKTIVWNGPLGIFEMEPFAAGTKAVGEFIGSLDAVSIIGGGDTAAAVSLFGLQKQMTHISTGGGASLEFLEGKTLPGVAALADRE
ncbi:MAG: phosphoglycerate kinase [Candidatus Omnitrophica bacterium]|nr:phosphoglycerate kinase [Candidatus Omnitrophota bacterium]